MRIFDQAGQNCVSLALGGRHYIVVLNKDTFLEKRILKQICKNHNVMARQAFLQDSVLADKFWHPAVAVIL